MDIRASGPALTDELFQNQENATPHTPYREELALLRCVRDGDVVRLAATYRALPETRYGKMSAERVRRLFYGCIANTTLVTRYAIEGGMDEEEAFSLSDIYIRRMERCADEAALHALNEEMALDFTRRVAAAKTRAAAYSPVVLRCMDCIHSRRHEKITLAALAEESHVSVKYLSARFRTETGRTITEYALEKKIEEAKSLLAYSDRSISEIANDLSFCSQSHFTAAFRKAAGLTPAAFRRANQVRGGGAG